MKLGIEKTAMIRVRAGISYALRVARRTIRLRVIIRPHGDVGAPTTTTITLVE